MKGVKKIIQIRKTRNGEVVKEFRTSTEAHTYFGYKFFDKCRHISRICCEKEFYGGFFWQYRILEEKKKSPDEQIIGKRIRIKQVETDGTWLEGTVNSFHSKTGKHEIIFDCGSIEHHKLETIQYEWKNDQRQKPIEQLDLKTGQVLATFKSISDAAALVETHPTHIVSVCMGRIRSRSGFFWRYKGSDALPPKPKGKRRVEQLCLTLGRVICTFDSITEAGKAIGISTPGISYCCNGRNGTDSAGGFGWRFAKSDT